MRSLDVAVLGDGEERRALDVLVTAFTADPVIRWPYPDTSRYLTHFPAFLRIRWEGVRVPDDPESAPLPASRVRGRGGPAGPGLPARLFDAPILEMAT